MNLRSQIALLLIALSILFVVSTYFVQLLVVMPAFVDLERQEAKRDVNRCVDALARDLEDVSNITNDWSAWDDSYQYVQDHNETFAKGNLVDQAFSTTHVNLICLLDLDRKIVWGESHDMKTLEVIDVPDLFAALQEESGPLTAHQKNDDFCKGVLLTSQGPILLASRPIITTLREGPIRGSVIMGRFLNEAEVKSLADRTHAAIDVWTPSQKEISEKTRLNFTECSETGETIVEVFDAKTLHAYTVIKDVYNQPALYLRVNIPRNITAQGRVSANVATLCSIAGGILTLFAVWRVMQWRIIGPLQKLASHAVRVGKQDNLKARLRFNRGDEIGTLANEFDSMVESLHQSRKRVLDTAHRAGMAEIATEVLHNVDTGSRQQLEAWRILGCINKPIRQSCLFDAIMRANGTETTNEPQQVEKSIESNNVVVAGTGYHVLVAEDNDINQVVIQQMLTRLGYTCTLVSNGQKAIDQAASRTFDLALMDCRMPVLDGFGAVSNIRRQEALGGGWGRRGERLPIIALTANAVAGDREACIAVGMNDYLTKPINRKELAETMERWLSLSEAQFGKTLPAATSDDIGFASVIADNPCFDREDFLDRCSGDSELAIVLLDMFTDTATNRLQAIQQAVLLQDRKQLVSIAHDLKSVAGNLSAGTLLKHTTTINQEYRDANCDLDSLLREVSSMQFEYKRCVDAVPDLRQSILMA